MALFLYSIPVIQYFSSDNTQSIHLILKPMDLRPAQPADFEAILALNLESVQFPSPLDSAKLKQLASQSTLFLVVEDAGAVIAFLLALREGASYNSPNYTWFASRYPQFLYVDRIVVSQSVKAKGTGSLLYKELFALAEASGVRQVACEIDIDPPNAISERFHARFGFKELGQQAVAGGSKRVSLQMAEAG